MNNIQNKLLIFLALILLGGSTYLYFSNTINGEAADSPLTSSLTDQSPAGVFTEDNNQASLDLAFIDTLASLKQINIDTTLFSSQSFSSLKDNTVMLETNIMTGRTNPFAPISASTNTGGNINLSPVSTNSPSQITDRTVVFEGAVGSISGVSIAYFEYGTTDKLGKVTSSSELSLIGTFVKKVVNLSPKTKYFFRAVARINGSLEYGEVMSFTTN